MTFCPRWKITKLESVTCVRARVGIERSNEISLIISSLSDDYQVTGSLLLSALFYPLKTLLVAIKTAGNSHCGGAVIAD